VLWCFYYTHIASSSHLTRFRYPLKDTASKLRPTHLGLTVLFSSVDGLAKAVDPHQAKIEAFFIDNLLVRIHLIIGMVLVDRPCAMGV